jgi:hypothetical protein
MGGLNSFSPFDLNAEFIPRRSGCLGIVEKTGRYSPNSHLRCAEVLPMNRILYSLPVAMVVLGGAAAMAIIILSVRTAFGIKPREPKI